MQNTSKNTKTKKYAIAAGTEVAFHNNVDYCVGTGRMGLALQKEYFEQLKFVQEKIGFKYIRGHGLFCDDMAIYQEYTDENGKTAVEYNFTYLDMVMDSYREVGLRPFLELGFMPNKMASGDQTVFYWKGNVTPPKDYEAWTTLVVVTLKHLMERYGADEVISWPIEVWNEPNLKDFWKDSDMQEYFRLFKCTFLAIKELDSRFRIGGPAVCGGTDAVWIQAFLEFCKENQLAVDFVTRHHYTIMPPEKIGHYDYVELHDPDTSLSELKSTREIVDSFEEYKGLEIHITEFNTSYTPRAPIHDTNQNAAYISYLLSKLGDAHTSYSYWTFGDIFEEKGVPFTPFHGGFGMVANGMIPKPTLWAFQFFTKLQGTCVHRSENSIVMKKDNGGYCGAAWNLDMQNDGNELELSFALPAEKAGGFCFLTKTVDEACCNPLKLWHDMGEPANLTKEQLAFLREGANPLLSSKRLTSDGKTFDITCNLSKNAIVYFEVNPVNGSSDRGYSYEKVIQPQERNK
jgi:xylan 1,4-beta-xylosidase